VVIGVREHQMVEITKGLTDADPVIVSGKDLVVDGTAVEPQPMPNKPAPASAPVEQLPPPVQS
jgi:hypothetical protein